jgi:uncharacterized protein (DUF697 family)
MGVSTELSDIANRTADQVGQAVVVTATDVGDAIATTTFEAGKAIVATTSGVGAAISNTVTQSGKATVETATAMGGLMSQTATQTSKAGFEWVRWMSETVTKQTYQLLEQTAHQTGQAVDLISDNWLIRRVSGVLKLDWLVGATDRVDLKKAEAAVRELQRKYPDESPSQIAHRLMVDKAVYAGGLGFVTSFLPGEAIALLAVDLATTTALQTEMVYQIAAAYGLDLRDPARKGEVLAVFGLAWGGNRALKAGLSFLRTVPMAGAIIGASTNSVMLYSLGYAACRFYEAKVREPIEPTSTTLDALQAEGEDYLNVAIAQQTVTDQILVHMITASYPNLSWEQILPKLAALQLSPASLQAIATSINSPQPMDELLNQLNRDYAMPLLAQCYRIARLDEVNSAEEVQVMEAIAQRFGIDLNSIKRLIDAELNGDRS